MLRDIATAGADRILCLGDVVGYGPQPAEVLESVYAEAQRVALGNHDAALCGRMDDTLFNDDARRVLDWTRHQLGDDAIKLASTWPLQLQGRGFRCAHATFHAPAQFGYIEEAGDAMASWSTVPDPLLFVGHTHRPAVFVLGQSGTPHLIEPQDFILEPEKRYIVNVGSVGQPRDGAPTASYALFDADANAVYFRRVPFDLDACRAAFEAAKLPPVVSMFLDADPLRGRRPLREIVSFRPPETAACGAQGAVELEAIESLRGRVRKWRMIAISLALASAAGLAAAGWFWQRRAFRSIEISPPYLPSLAAASRPAGENLLTTPAGGELPMEGWTIRLGNRRAQTIAAVEPEKEGQPAFEWTSDDGDHPLELVSGPIRVEPGQRISIEGVFVRSPDFEGMLAVGLVLQRTISGIEETIENFLVKEPNERRKEGMAARATVEVPAGGQELRFRIFGRFRGSVRVVSVSLARR